MSQAKIKRPALLGLLGLLIGRLVLQLNLYRIGFESLMADDFGRTLLAAKWAEAPYLAWDGFWLPFHMYLHGIALKLSWNFYDTPRVINTILGLAAIILIYYLTLELFQSESAALISAVLLTVNPVHLWLSATTLAEVPQSTLAFAAILAVILYLKHRTNRYLYASALALALGNGFRYESWMVSAVFSAYLGIAFLRAFRHRDSRNRQLFHLAAAAILPWLFPLAWMIGNQIVHNDFLFFLTVTKNYKLTWYGTERSYGNYWPWLWQVDPFTSVLALFLLLLAFIKFRHSQSFRWFFLAATVPFLMFLYLHGGQIDEPGNYLRYLTPFLILFYPLMAFAIDGGIKKVTSKPVLRVAGVGFIVGLISLTQLSTAFQFSQNLQGYEAGQRIRVLRQEEDDLAYRPFLIELVYWEQLAIHIGANDISPLILYDRSFDAKRQSTSLFESDLETIRDCLAQYDVAYILLKSPPLIQVAEEGLHLTAVEQISGYSFYKIPPEWYVGTTATCSVNLESYQ
ncbi:MAG: glycosyltransferase family 39 protein [Candidatus Promineifilaceae bacterium]